MFTTLKDKTPHAGEALTNNNKYRAGIQIFNRASKQSCADGWMQQVLVGGVCPFECVCVFTGWEEGKWLKMHSSI